MKAKDYYNKYKDRLTDAEEATKAIQELIMEFIQETKELLNKRNVRSDRGVMAVVNEQNNKWNALCSYFDPPVIKRNSYQIIVLKTLGIVADTAARIRRGQINIPN